MFRKTYFRSFVEKERISGFVESHPAIQDEALLAEDVGASAADNVAAVVDHEAF